MNFLLTTLTIFLALMYDSERNKHLKQIYKVAFNISVKIIEPYFIKLERLAEIKWSRFLWSQ